MALSFPIFWAIQTRDPLTVVLGFVIGMSVGHGIMYGVQASFPCRGHDAGRSVCEGNCPGGRKTRARAAESRGGTRRLREVPGAEAEKRCVFSCTPSSAARR